MDVFKDNYSATTFSWHGYKMFLNTLIIVIYPNLLRLSITYWHVFPLVHEYSFLSEITLFNVHVLVFMSFLWYFT